VLGIFAVPLSAAGGRRKLTGIATAVTRLSRVVFDIEPTAGCRAIDARRGTELNAEGWMASISTLMSLGPVGAMQTHRRWAVGWAAPPSGSVPGRSTVRSMLSSSAAGLVWEGNETPAGTGLMWRWWSWETCGRSVAVDPRRDTSTIDASGRSLTEVP
jgi:hypothetical protein